MKSSVCLSKSAASGLPYKALEEEYLIQIVDSDFICRWSACGTGTLQVFPYQFLEVFVRAEVRFPFHWEGIKTSIITTKKGSPIARQTNMALSNLQL